METIVRTIYGSHIQTCKYLNLPFYLLPNSTLNQKFNNFAEEQISAYQYPTLAYMGIGNKGVEYEVGANNFILTKPIPHIPRHASLYNFIPFLVREIDNDIPADERKKYRMRVIRDIGNSTYIFYYLRKLDFTTVQAEVELRNVQDGNVTAQAFVPDQYDLNPVPPQISNVNLNNPNGDYLASSAKVSVKLSQRDVEEIMQACNILYGDSRYAVISEIALCTGVDREVSGRIGNTTVPYIEAVGVQVAAFLYQYYALNNNVEGVTIKYDIGAVEPLLT